PDLRLNGCEPGCTIRIGERNPLLHFFFIGGRMKIVSIGKLPVQALSQELAHGGLTRSFDAHHQNDHLYVTNVSHKPMNADTLFARVTHSWMRVSDRVQYSTAARRSELLKFTGTSL